MKKRLKEIKIDLITNSKRLMTEDEIEVLAKEKLLKDGLVPPTDDEIEEEAWHSILKVVDYSEEEI